MERKRKNEKQNFLRRVNLNDKEELQKIAEEYLVPLYGDQEKALRGWLTGDDYKTSWVAVDEKGKIMGLLVISDKPSREYVKISTLLVLRQFQDRRTGRLLLKRAIEYLRYSKKNKMIVTVSENVPDSLVFFLRNKFDIIAKKVGRYKPGIVEFILQCQKQKED